MVDDWEFQDDYFFKIIKECILIFSFCTQDEKNEEDDKLKKENEIEKEKE